MHLERSATSRWSRSRARRWSKLEAFKRRMGWTFKWVSSAGNDFNFDYHVSFTPEDAGEGQRLTTTTTQPSVRWRSCRASACSTGRGGAVFHTYSCYARGLDMMNAAYHYLDLVPKGRDKYGRTRWLGCATAIATAVDANHHIEPSFRCDCFPPHPGAQARAAPRPEEGACRVFDFVKCLTGHGPAMTP